MSFSWNTNHSNSSNLLGTYRSKRLRENANTGVMFPHATELDSSYNIDLVPIKRLRIETLSPVPDSSHVFIQNSFLPSSHVEPEPELSESQDQEMYYSTRCNDGFRDDGGMDSSSESFTATTYHDMNNVLGSLHAERMKRMSQDRNSPKAFALEETAMSPVTQASQYNSRNDPRLSEANHSLMSNNHFVRDSHVSLQDHPSMQSHGNSHEGKIHNARRQTKLKYDSQLY